jgi:hypothetical protein
VQVFAVEDSSVLDEFVRKNGKEGYLVLVQYFGEAAQEAKEQTESGKDEVAGAIRSALVELGGEDIDVGAFKLRRAYASGIKS